MKKYAAYIARHINSSEQGKGTRFEGCISPWIEGYTIVSQPFYTDTLLYK